MIITLTWVGSSLPSLEPIQALRDSGQSIAYEDRDGVYIGRRGPPRPNIEELWEVAPHVPAAVVAMEDRRFFEHDGVDLVSFAGVIFSHLLGNDGRGGGSTISMQVVKNVYGASELGSPMVRKLKEIFLAYDIEERFSKHEVLGMYFQVVYALPNERGLEGASRYYFHKRLKDLTPVEAARIAATLRSAPIYDPVRQPEASRLRAAKVLAKMEKGVHGPGGRHYKLSGAEYAEAVAANDTMVVKPWRGEPKFFLDWVDREVRRAFAGRGDLTVRTTIDIDDQSAALAAIKDAVDSGAVGKGRQAALVAVDDDGAVRAMVGAKEYRAGFNYATDGGRPVASTLKPFIVATALEAGASPDQTCDDAPFSIGGWTPSNADHQVLGREIPLGILIERSRNLAAVRLGEQLGAPAMRDLLDNVGLDFVREGKSKAGKPITVRGAFPERDPQAWIGGNGLSASPLRLATAYATFANGGSHVEPHGFTLVADRNGRPIFERRDQLSRAMSAETADAVTRMMLGVVYGADGTGGPAAVPGWSIAGKTGTNQDNLDAWFVGFAPRRVAAVWIGPSAGAKASRGKVRGSDAADIFGTYMRQALADERPRGFGLTPATDVVTAGGRVTVGQGSRSGLTCNSEATGGSAL